MRVNIPEFDRDTLNPEGFIDWFDAVEEVFEFKEWLQNLNQGNKSVKDYTTDLNQLIARKDIHESDDQLVSHYISGLRVKIIDYVKMFDPVSLSDAVLTTSEESKYPFFEGDGSSFDEWGDDGVVGDDYEGPPVFDDDQYEKESMLVYDSDIEDVIEEEEGLIEKGRFGGKKTPLKMSLLRWFWFENVASHFVPNQARPGVGSVDDGVANENYEEALVCDDDKYKEDVMTGDVGVNLMARRSCLTAQAIGVDWLNHNILLSTCTILGHVSTFVVDSGSCDNLIAEEAV
ncbi:putative reverse transcriptase domain-containing protein [Tanacetum coccineum]